VTTEIYRGKYKRLVTDGPLSEEALRHMEGKVDYFYTLFIDAVARFRGVTAETVLTTMSTDVNDIFIGQQAVDAGLIDGIAPFDAAVSQALTLASSVRTQGISLITTKEVAMEKLNTLAELVAAYPDFAAELRAEGAHSVDVEAAKAAERDRILGLVTAQFGAEGEKLSTLVASGVSVEQFKAITAMNPPQSAGKSAEELKKEEILAGLKGSGAAPVGADGNLRHGMEKDFPTLVEEHITAEKCTRSVAIRAVDAAHPGLREKWLAVINGGKEATNV
jgi:hypothetical protein